MSCLDRVPVCYDVVKFVVICQLLVQQNQPCKRERAAAIADHGCSQNQTPMLLTKFLRSPEAIRFHILVASTKQQQLLVEAVVVAVAIWNRNRVGW